MKPKRNSRRENRKLVYRLIMRLRCGHTALVIAILALCVAAASPPLHAQDATPVQPWTVTTLETRKAADGTPVTIAVAVRVPGQQPAKHVVLYPSPNGKPFLKVNNGTMALDLIGPWVRASEALNQRGVVVVFADVPSDALGQEIGRRAPADVRRDLQAVVDYLRKSFAGVPLHLGLFGSTAMPVLDNASRIRGVTRIAIASGAFLNARERNWRGLDTPVMLIHAPSATCAATPFFEAQWVARKNGFTLVEAGYERSSSQFECGRGSQHLLTNLEAEFADTVLRWFDGAPVPGHIGHVNAPVAWREQVVTYPAPGMFGVNQLEMTLLFPEGPGPFPVAIFNHGDVDMDHAVIRNRQRTREIIVAREFLQHGIAVALPARRGVGMSEGNYPTGFARQDGDPTYKARVHAQDILPALDYLKTRAEIDTRRVILTGHSAGGYSVSYIASIQPPGVIGVINFSGGRTDAGQAESAGALNRMMVSGFAELGKATRMPSLWVFAENDSRYSAATIRASHAAYIAAGGVARLSLSPPIAGDGHFIYHRPDLWRGALKDFLAETGVLKSPDGASP